MTSSTSQPGWTAITILVGRLIFLAFFTMAFSVKFMDINGTAGYIAFAGFPVPTALAWLAVIFEVLLVLGFLTGAYFAETCLLAGLYVTFLGLTFHGPSYWQGEVGQHEFRAFLMHFTMLAGLLFAAAHGPGRILASRKTIIGRYPA
ncbi:DoxX family protein [Dongia deserti]|uniref:DoxX family protein n=1 Tax=Dongia deserti TaxID=2268030 RepID=UPI000E653246|nr:DoxX family protein [Dongia deserti]